VCVACEKKKRNAYNVLMRIPEGKETEVIWSFYVSLRKEVSDSLL